MKTTTTIRPGRLLNPGSSDVNIESTSNPHNGAPTTATTETSPETSTETTEGSTTPLPGQVPCTSLSLSLESLNCKPGKGFKQSCDYIIKRLINDCDVMCLSETWLRPGDLYLVDEALNPLNTRLLCYCSVSEMRLFYDVIVISCNQTRRSPGLVSEWSP